MDEKELEERKAKFLDKQSRHRIRSLFWECRFDPTQDGYEAIYTLNEHDKAGCKSLKQGYLTLADPTEYEFAQMYFYSWKHWQIVSNATWFKPHIEEWREELSVKLKSQGLRSLIDTVEQGGKEAIAPSKYLAEEGWIKQGKGRPSKTDIKKEARIIAKTQAETDEDAQRIGLVH